MSASRRRAACRSSAALRARPPGLPRPLWGRARLGVAAAGPSSRSCRSRRRPQCSCRTRTCAATRRPRRRPWRARARSLRTRVASSAYTPVECARYLRSDLPRSLAAVQAHFARVEPGERAAPEQLRRDAALLHESREFPLDGSAHEQVLAGAKLKAFEHEPLDVEIHVQATRAP